MKSIALLLTFIYKSGKFHVLNSWKFLCRKRPNTKIEVLWKHETDGNLFLPVHFPFFQDFFFFFKQCTIVFNFCKTWPIIWITFIVLRCTIQLYIFTRVTVSWIVKKRKERNRSMTKILRYYRLLRIKMSNIGSIGNENQCWLESYTGSGDWIYSNPTYSRFRSCRLHLSSLFCNPLFQKKK